MADRADLVMATPEHSAALASLARMLRGDLRPRLTLVRGDEQADLPDPVLEILTRIADLMASGRGVIVLPVDKELTTREAAELLGVSRPTLIKLLDAGEIGYTRPHSSRRIPLQQVMAYKERRSRRRRTPLSELTAEAVEQGTYGIPSDDVA